MPLPMDVNPENLRYILGLKVRKYRQSKGFGLKELAQASGLSVSYLSEIEKGRKYPKPDKILKLAEGLGVPFDELVSLRVDEELGAVRDLFSSPFIREFPFHVFGIEPEAILDLVTEVPSRAGALLRTFLEMGRTYDVRVEHFLFAALRSYQYMFKNHFPAIEKKAAAFLAAHGWEGETTLGEAQLRQVVEEELGYEVDYEGLDRFPALRGLRSVWIDGERPRLLINGRLLARQKAFILGREIGYPVLKLKERSTTSSWLQVRSFDQVINDFQAAYFAGAVLLQKPLLVADLERFFRRRKWSAKAFLKMMGRFRATPETFFYRLSQIVPVAFGLEAIFFVRFNNEVGTPQVRLTKILNMSEVPVPHGVGLNEHYCRRWPGLKLLQELAAAGIDAADEVRIAVQRSHFLNDDTEFFVISVGRPLALTEGVNSSISLGFLMDGAFKRRVRFWNDPAVPRIDVNLTCERCGLEDCAERVAPPDLAEATANHRARERQLEALIEEVQASRAADGR